MVKPPTVKGPHSAPAAAWAGATAMGARQGGSSGYARPAIQCMQVSFLDQPSRHHLGVGACHILGHGSAARWRSASPCPLATDQQRGARSFFGNQSRIQWRCASRVKIPHFSSCCLPAGARRRGPVWLEIAGGGATCQYENSFCRQAGLAPGGQDCDHGAHCLRLPLCHQRLTHMQRIAWLAKSSVPVPPPRRGTFDDGPLAGFPPRQ